MSAVNRLAAQAEAERTLAQAKAAYDAALALESSLSEGEHPDVLIAAEDDFYRAEIAYRAAQSAARLARIAYANPFGVAGNYGMR